MSKAVFIINIGAPKNFYQYSIPSIKAYASRIDADFIEVTNKAFAGFPFSYEKTQIYELGKDNDWNIYIDADYLIRDNLFDVTEVCPIDAIGQWGPYGADSWFEMDAVFLNDTEEVNIEPRVCDHCGTHLEDAKVESRPRFLAFTDCFVVASKQCHEIWRPLPFSYSEALLFARRDHWIGEYTLARNLAQNHYKLFTFQSDACKLGAQSNKDMLCHIEVTTRNPYINLDKINNYLLKNIDEI